MMKMTKKKPKITEVNNMDKTNYATMKPITLIVEDFRNDLPGKKGGSHNEENI